MREILMEWIPWGLGIIVDIQSVTGGWLDTFFRVITYMGQEPFFLLLLPALFWSVDKRQSIRLVLVFLISEYLNVALKQIFAIPRPFEVSQQVRPKVVITGYSFPSGHAQGAATIWPSLAYIFRKPWLSVLALILVVLISFSRVYLGVHYPQDVIAGILLGLFVVVLYFRLEPALASWFARRSLAWQLAGAVVIPALFMLLIPVETVLTVGGGMIGLGAGYILEGRQIDFQPRSGVWPALGRMLMGLAIVAVVYVGLKGLFPSRGPLLVVAALRAFRYACIGLATTLLAPWVFVKAGLAAETSPQSAYQA